MADYIDGFVFPIAKEDLNEYKNIAEQVAGIWKEHGAISYMEFISDGSKFEGTLPFSQLLQTKDKETVVFGWVVFRSKEERDLANKRVASDPRMAEITMPLVKPRLIFDASRMAYGGFKTLVEG